MEKSDKTNGNCLNEIEEPKECCSARNVLWYLVFVGFAVNYMIRINLNIAIVSMVPAKAKDNISLTSECIVETTTLANLATRTLYLENVSYADTRNSNASHWLKLNHSQSEPDHVKKNGSTQESQKSDHEKLFMWDEKVQGKVLGSFFWLHWLTQIPGGLLAGKYGTKLVFGLSNFGGVIFCYLIPYAAMLGYNYLVALRLIQGLVAGFAWPSMHNMTARWIPPNERSKFVTAYLGSSVGTALTYPICGFIIDKWGWEYAFYACGVFGTVWFIAWWTLVYDSPSEHPRISEFEKDYIVKSLGESFLKDKPPVPWRCILRSKTVWMCIATHAGGLWGLFTLMTHAPTYFKFIHGWDIKATGLLSGMPHMFRMLWAYVFSQIGDFLLKTNRITRTNVRKLAAVFSCMGQGIFMICLAYSGCNSVAAIMFLTSAVAIHGAVSTGPLATPVDISPNYASVVLGLMNTCAAFVGFITPALVGYLTFQNQTSAQWQKVFWVASFFLFLTGICFVIFAKSELKSWNNPDKRKEDAPETELMLVKSEKGDAKTEDEERNGNGVAI